MIAFANNSTQYKKVFSTFVRKFDAKSPVVEHHMYN